jgi:hypothetical protein
VRSQPFELATFTSLTRTRFRVAGRRVERGHASVGDCSLRWLTIQPPSLVRAAGLELGPCAAKLAAKAFVVAGASAANGALAPDALAVALVAATSGQAAAADAGCAAV